MKIKRVYEEWEKTDGFRILVDRLWPRGISKEHARVDLWLKEIAPSDELRKWFGHDPEKWEEFVKKYKQELEKKKDLVEQVRDWEKQQGMVTLVYGAKDTEHNQAVVLREVIVSNAVSERDSR